MSLPETIDCPACSQSTPAQRFCIHCGQFLADVNFSNDETQMLRPVSLVGHIIHERYEVRDLIGEGGMGAVYQGRDTRLNREVAIKITTDIDLKERFLREAEIMANLNHENIVSVYDRGEYKKAAFIVMEYIKGESLENVFKQQGISFYDTLVIMREVSLGLEYIHQKGITHRDIKPANIMLLSDNRIKIMDFGISKDYSRSELTTLGNPVFGTPAYMSPEFLLGHKVDARTDIYSLGMMAYKLFVGRLPFVRGDIKLQQIHAAAEPPRQINPMIPPLVEKIILKCIEKNPDNRYQSMKELREDLEGALASISAPTIESGTDHGCHCVPATNPAATPPHLLNPLRTSTHFSPSGSGLTSTMTLRPASRTGDLSLGPPRHADRNWLPPILFGLVIGCALGVFWWLLPAINDIAFTPIAAKSVLVGQEVTFSVSASRLLRSGKLTFEVIGMPSGANFYQRNQAQYIFNWRPARTDVGSHSLEFIARDGQHHKKLVVEIQVVDRHGLKPANPSRP